MAHRTVITAILAFSSILPQLSLAQSTVMNPGFGFSFIGCYNEIQNARALPDALLVGSQQNMTVEICAEFCSAYLFFGVEYGSECYCGNSVSNASSEVTTESGLNCQNPVYACVGNANEMCGGFQAYDLYAQAGATTTAVPPSHTGFVYVMDSFIVQNASNSGGTYNYIGCFNDPGDPMRALNGNSAKYGSSSVEECANFCVGYTYFGLESAGECYCGNAIENNAALVACQDECYACCSDDLSERCGGYYRLSMYELNGPAYVEPSQPACTYNGPATAIVQGSSTYTYYGPITTGSTDTAIVTTDMDGATTSYTSTEFFCDGGNCQTNPHTPGASITATHYPSTPATPTATPTNKANIAGCSYSGCYDDNGAPQALAYLQAQLDTSVLTAELCVKVCLGAGYAYAGLEYGSQCFCGSAITAPHTILNPGEVTASGVIMSCTDAAFACTGDQTEQCGGFAAMSIYYCPQNGPRHGNFSLPSTSSSLSAATSSMLVASTPPIASSPPVASSPAMASSPTMASSPAMASSPHVASSPAMASSPPVPSTLPVGSMSMSSMFGMSSISTSWGTRSGSMCTRKTTVLPVPMGGMNGY